MSIRSFDEHQNFTDEDHVYVNINIDNKTDNVFKIANFNVTRTIPFIKNPSEYYMTVVRFSAPGNVPLFIYPNDGKVANNTFYSVTLQSANKTSQKFLIHTNYFGPDTNASEAIYPFGILYYQHMLNMVNTALAAAFTEVNNAGGVTATAPPFFIYESDTNLFSLIAQERYDPQTSFAGTGIRIYLNIQLHRFFKTIRSEFNGINTSVGRTYIYPVQDYGNNLTTAISGVPAFEMRGEYANASAWRDFISIVFTTGTLPVRYEETPSEINDKPLFRPIVSEFFDNTRGFGRQHIFYEPTAEYKRIDLLGNIPINTIDLDVFWQKRDGTPFALPIPPRSSVKMKILFEKKKFISEKKFELTV